MDRKTIIIAALAAMVVSIIIGFYIASRNTDPCHHTDGPWYLHMVAPAVAALIFWRSK